MSIPGIKKEKIVKQELVMIQSFLLLKTPVTNELYNYVTDTDYDIQTKTFPVVNISWIDAIKFCNLLSEKLSLEKCYTLNSAGYPENLHSQAARKNSTRPPHPSHKEKRYNIMARKYG